MSNNLNYLDDFDIYYTDAIPDGTEFHSSRNKWYKVTYIFSLKEAPKKNTYYVPFPRLEEFLKYNLEQLVDIEPMTLEDVINTLSND